jgi:GT2 family glycosyltransferase
LCHPSVLLRRSALDGVGGWRETAWAEDYDLWLRLDAAGWELAKLPRTLLRWRCVEGRATFTSARYAKERFREARARFLVPKLRALARPVAVWGAGQTGRRLARALEPFGLRADLFIDIDEKKIGRIARGVPIIGPGAIPTATHTVLVAVGARGARVVVRSALVERGLVEGRDFLCAA